MVFSMTWLQKVLSPTSPPIRMHLRMATAPSVVKMQCAVLRPHLGDLQGLPTQTAYAHKLALFDASNCLWQRSAARVPNSISQYPTQLLLHLAPTLDLTHTPATAGACPNLGCPLYRSAPARPLTHLAPSISTRRLVSLASSSCVW